MTPFICENMSKTFQNPFYYPQKPNAIKKSLIVQKFEFHR